jgi:sugar phosphate isomerase/epimerase
VFTKPWPELPLADLGKFVKNLGFDGIELPVRPGYQVPPEEVAKALPEAAKVLADQGIKIGSIAGPTDERTITACAKAGVPIIRVCVDIDMRIGYMATEAKIRSRYDALIPLLEQSGVAIGVQNHCGHDVGSAIGIMHLIEHYHPEHVGAVLDLGHCGLDGEPDDMAIDIAWSHLLLVNLKSAYWIRKNGPEVRDAEWDAYWTTGGYGISNWKLAAETLKSRGYDKDICLTAEYSQHDRVDELIADDITYIRSLFGE